MISLLGVSLVNRNDAVAWDEPNVELKNTKMCSTTSEVKDYHDHVITQGICNKFIEVNFCV